MLNRILIVEDDHAISDAVALNMQFIGYEYAVFDNGKKVADSLVGDHAYVAVGRGELRRLRAGVNRHILGYDVGKIYCLHSSSSPLATRGTRLLTSLPLPSCFT